MAYADDINLVASTKSGLQELLNIASTYLGSCGLDINTTKSRTISSQLQPKQKRQVVLANQRFNVEGRPLTACKRSDEWRNLVETFNGDGRVRYSGEIHAELGRLDRAHSSPSKSYSRCKPVCSPVSSMCYPWIGRTWAASEGCTGTCGAGPESG